MPFGTAVPLAPYSALHLGTIAHCVFGCTLTVHETRNQSPALEPQVRMDSRWEKNHVDEIMCYLQGTSKEAPIVGFGTLPLRMGVAECRSGSREPD